MGFIDFFIKDIETSDNHRNRELKTHYYKSEYKEAKEIVIRYLNQKKIKVTNIDDNYGEIFVETSSFHMIISIRSPRILYVSIDIKISVYSLVGAYKPHKYIKEIYSYLDKELPFIGKGLQP